MLMGQLSKVLSLGFLCMLAVGCGEDTSSQNKDQPRPVTVVILRESDPSVKLDLTGSAEAAAAKSGFKSSAM